MGVQNDGFDKEVKRMSKLAKVYDNKTRKYCTLMTLFLFNQAVDNTPVITGELQRSWTYTLPVKEGYRYIGIVENHKEYGIHVEYGHRIVSNYKYVGVVEGKYFFTQAKNNLKKAKESFRNDMKREIHRELML